LFELLKRNLHKRVRVVRVDPPKTTRKYVVLLPGGLSTLSFSVDQLVPLLIEGRGVAWQGLSNDGELVCQFPWREEYRLVPAEQVSFEELEEDEPPVVEDAREEDASRGYM
jgi:hypothetical protein